MLETLARDLEAEKREAAFVALVFLLYAALQKDNDDALAATLAALGTSVYARAFGLSGTVQARTLKQRPSTLIRVLSERYGLSFGSVMQRRVTTVLARPHSEAQLRAYGSLLSEVSVNFGARQGFEVVGKAGGATKKTFIRVRAAKEPRPHSKLEGLTIPKTQNFLIDGYSVPVPADPKLPLSSRLRCGHCCLYQI